LAAGFSKLIDLRAMLALGLALFACGLWMNGFLNAEAAFTELFWPQAIRGLALMLCFVPINTLALGTLPESRLANASGLYNLMRNLGGAIGIAAANTALANRHALHVAHIGENLQMQWHTEVLARSVTEISPEADAWLLAGLVGREAAVMAYNDVFVTMGSGFAVAVVLTALVRRVAPSNS
jgi:MFS transporter, DHA2 family, multidrug resistance protein